jgi:outer membrane autotransporter protein
MKSKHYKLVPTVIAASIFYMSTSAQAACTDTPAAVRATDGSICTMSLPNYSVVPLQTNSSPVSAVGVGSELSGTSASVQSTTAIPDPLVHVSAGAKLTVTDSLSIQLSNYSEGEGIRSDFSSVANLNNLTVTVNQADGLEAVSAYDTGVINVAGHTQVTLNDSPESIGILSTGLQETSGPTTITLNTANVNINGEISAGIWADGRGSVTGAGKVDVAVNGADSMALLLADGGGVSLTGGGVISASGLGSVALKAAFLSDEGVSVPLGAVNKVVLKNYVLSASQGNVMEVKGGESSISLEQTQASASSGYQLLFVNDGSDDEVLEIEPTPAKLVLSASGSTLSGDITVADDGSQGSLTFTNGSSYTGTMNNVTNATFDASSRWSMTGSSNLTEDLSNAGTIYFQNLGNTLTVNGNYNGTSGSVISLETRLGDDGSATDKLHVLGDTTGTTRLDIRNAGGTGAQTTNGINIVQVDGTSEANSFTMAAPVQAGSYEYTLKQGSAVDANDWYLTSQYTTNPSNPTETPADVNIYRPAVAVYTAAQAANEDAAFTQISTLHQRMGEQRDAQANAPQTWGRMIGAGQSNQGQNRFGYSQTTTGFQLGHDLVSRTSGSGLQQHAGVAFGYAHSSIDVDDNVRPLVNLAKGTGSINGRSIGMNGYYTAMTKDGAYLDAVAQVNHLRNEYTDSYAGQATQRGWQFGLSAEVGKPMAELKGWSVEPQAQLSYLYSKYDDFSDAYSTVSGENQQQLRGRVGLRLSKDVTVDGKQAQYYGIVNVTHNFMNPDAITLRDRNSSGSTTVSERFDRTSAEIGAGIQGNVSKSATLYADARYQHSFKGNKEGAQINAGVKVNF